MSIASQFSGLPMSDLIGGPLMASCEAQKNMALATAGFIKDIGLIDDGSGNMSLNVVNFEYDKDLQEDDGSWTTAKHTIKTPLLAIVNVPSLSMKIVTVDFEMEVKSSSSDSRDTTKKAAVSGSWSGWGAKVQFSGSISANNKSSRTSDSSAKYTVHVEARDDGPPEGLMKMMDTLNAAILETPSS
jgi:hypothetical protein